MARFSYLPLIICLLILIVCWPAALRYHDAQTTPIIPSTQIIQPTAWPSANASARPFIAGGVQSVSDFRVALDADAALRRQFPDFDFAHARFERLARPECVFVAYRSGNDFAWTHRCKILRAGELILTDGKYRIRARCGNALSFTPEAPLLPNDVDELGIEPDPIPPPTNLIAGIAAPTPISPGPPLPSPTPPPGVPPMPAPPTYPVCLNCGPVVGREKVPEAGDAFIYLLVAIFAVACGYAAQTRAK